MPVSRTPLKVKQLLETVTEGLPKVLGKDLFGIYVYGSLTYNAFNPSTSDVDAIAVLNKNLTIGQLHQLRIFQRRLVAIYGSRRGRDICGKDLELTYVNRSRLFKPSVVYGHWGGKIRKNKGWCSLDPIHCLNLKNSGITIFGPPVKTWI